MSPQGATVYSPPLRAERKQDVSPRRRAFPVDLGSPLFLRADLPVRPDLLALLHHLDLPPSGNVRDDHRPHLHAQSESEEGRPGPHIGVQKWLAVGRDVGDDEVL